MADKVKSLLRGPEAHITKKHDGKLSNVGAMMAQQHDGVDERVRNLEREVSFVKAAVTGDLAAPRPGYPGADRAAFMTCAAHTTFAVAPPHSSLWRPPWGPAPRRRA